MYINPQEDPIQPKLPYFDWADDDTLTEVYVLRNSPSRRVLFSELAFPVSQEGYDRLTELANVLDQMRQYITERLDFQVQIGYNVAYGNNKSAKQPELSTGGGRTGTDSKAA